MTDGALLAAFLGGVLSLLSPCSALLLPMFFAYAFTSRTELFAKTLLFLAGLSAVFVPLGMGASLAGALLLDYREATVLASGLLLVGFGALEILGKGFTLLPQRVAGRLQSGGSVAAVFSTGLVYGVTGFCSGPLLAGVLTVAATLATPLFGATLLFAYALGTAAPLFGLAWAWDRWRLGTRGWLRGRALRIGPLETHTVSLAAGLLLIALGISFIILQGGSALSVLYADLGLEAVSYQAQLWVTERLR